MLRLHKITLSCFNFTTILVYSCAERQVRSAHRALIEKTLVILSLTGGARVGHTQSDELTDVSVLVSLQLRPETKQKFSKDSQKYPAKSIRLWMFLTVVVILKSHGIGLLTAGTVIVLSTPQSFTPLTSLGTNYFIYWHSDSSQNQHRNTHWQQFWCAQTVCGSLQVKTTVWVLCRILLHLLSITAAPWMIQQCFCG